MVQRVLNRALASVLAAIGFLAPSEAESQAATDRVVARDSSARMERIADVVYAIIHDAATDNWPHGNTGVIVGSDGVLVIDSNYLPIRAARDIALIRKVTPLPVRYLVNTHWHGDHTHGNGVYRDSFPNIAIVGPKASAYFVEMNQEKLPKGALLPNSANRTALANLEARVSTGKDTAGRPLSAEEKARLTRNLVRRRVEMEALAKVKVAGPTLLFEQELVLHVGTKRVELRDRGRANSPNDVTIYLPAERVLFTGDILVHPLPFAFGVWPLPWIDVLKQLEAIPVAALVPGHGPVMSDHSYTRLVRELMETMRTRVDSVFRQGLNMVTAPPAVGMQDFRARFIMNDGNPISEADWAGWVRNLAEQMVQCVHGYRC